MHTRYAECTDTTAPHAAHRTVIPVQKSPHTHIHIYVPLYIRIACKGCLIKNTAEGQGVAGGGVGQGYNGAPWAGARAPEPDASEMRRRLQGNACM